MGFKWMDKNIRDRELDNLEAHQKSGTVDDGIIEYLNKLNGCGDIVTVGCCTGHKDDKGEVDHDRSLPYLAVMTSEDVGHYIEHSIFEEFIKLGWASRCDKRVSMKEVERENDDIEVVYVFYGILYDFESLQNIIDRLVLRVDLFTKALDRSALY